MAVFNRNFNVGDLEDVVTRFKAGASADVADSMPSEDYVRLVRQIEGLDQAVAKIAPSNNAAETAAALEFILEGLHLNKRLNKDKVSGHVQYRG